MPPALGKSLKSLKKVDSFHIGEYSQGIPLVEKDNGLEYIVNLQNKDFIINLKRIHLPADRKGILRAFVHTGDEMFYQDRGIHDGDILLGNKLESIPKKIKAETVYVLVTSRGLITRRIFAVDENDIQLHADNAAYENIKITKEDMIELWEVVGVWSNLISPPSMLESRLMTVENQVNKLYSRLLKLEKQ
jgi:hypothetical protein